MRTMAVVLVLSVAGCGEQLVVGQVGSDAATAEGSVADAGELPDPQAGLPCPPCGIGWCFGELWFECSGGCLRSTGQECCHSPGEQRCISNERWVCSVPAGGIEGAWQLVDGECDSDDNRCTFAYSWIAENPGLEAGGTESTLGTISGTSATDVWVFPTGATDVVFHRGADGWTMLPLPAVDTIHAAWSTSPEDAWAVGAQGAVLHWNGAEWSRQSLESGCYGMAVWSSGPDDVWVAGCYGGAEHWDGLAWTPVTIDVVALWGASADDVWALGEQAVSHWNGTSWQLENVSFPSVARAISGSASSDVWIVGHASASCGGWPSIPAGFVAHWDGSSWARVPGPFSDAWLNGVWGSSAAGVWTCDYGRLWHWDGSWWCWIDFPGQVARGLGPDPDDVWGVSGAEVVHLSR